MKTVVTNATPIISLACIDKLFLLETLFQKVFIPSAVYYEIKPLLDEMIEKGRWYSQKVYDYFLTRIGEK